MTKEYSEFLTLSEAKEYLEVTDDLLHSKIIEHNLDLVFFYHGGVAHNETMEMLHNNYEVDPTAIFYYDSGSPQTNDEPNPKGHFTFELSAWLMCKKKDVLTKGSSFQFTAEVYKPLLKNNLNKGDIIGLFQFITPVDSKLGIFPANNNYQGCGKEISKNDLYIPLSQLEKIKQTNTNKQDFAINCKAQNKQNIDTETKKQTRKKDYSTYLKDYKEPLTVIGAIIKYVEDKNIYKTQGTLFDDMKIVCPNYKGTSKGTTDNVFGSANKVFNEETKINNSFDYQGNPYIILGALLHLLKMNENEKKQRKEKEGLESTKALDIEVQEVIKNIVESKDKNINYSEPLLTHSETLLTEFSLNDNFSKEILLDILFTSCKELKNNQK